MTDECVLSTALKKPIKLFCLLDIMCPLHVVVPESMSGLRSKTLEEG
jgi:hypothetical protein